MHQRKFSARTALVALLGFFTFGITASAQTPPNIVLIVADDLGTAIWARTATRPSGHRTSIAWRSKARNGRRSTWRNRCIAEPGGTANGASADSERDERCRQPPTRVLPRFDGRAAASEITLAELLKARGYATAFVGKWHLGHVRASLPIAHGFDSYFGIPYSNDMDMIAIPGASIGGEDPRKRERIMNPRIEYWNVPLMHDAVVIERPADQRSITRRYTEEATTFIGKHAAGPFLLYLAHTMPHVPLFASREFAGRSPRGVYGDVVEEIDWSVGQVVNTLRKLGLDKRTIVVFLSDNGPWALFDEQGGSAGPFRGSKGGTMEGGMRVPAISGAQASSDRASSRTWAARWTWCRRCARSRARGRRRSHARRPRPVSRTAPDRAQPARDDVLLPGSRLFAAPTRAVQGALLHAAGVRQRGREGARSSLAVQPRPGSRRAVRYRCETSGSHHADSDDRLGSCAHDRAR